MVPKYQNNKSRFHNLGSLSNFHLTTKNCEYKAQFFKFEMMWTYRNDFNNVMKQAWHANSEEPKCINYNTLIIYIRMLLDNGPHLGPLELNWL